MLTVLEIIKKTTDFFATRGIENPRLNAELLVGHGLGLARMQLYLQFERPLAEADLEKIRPLVRRRGQREPLQYIVGETEFAGLKLKTDRRALIPRPETELLVEWLTAPSDRPPPRSVLDLGTGTGAIALALARHFPEAVVTAVDLSDDALALAAENAERTGLAGRVRWLKSDWFSALPNETFDWIVGNPPYLTAAETAAAEPEVRDHEPVNALTSGEDGMNALRAILADAPKHLEPAGVLALETGVAQHEALREIAARAGFSRTESRQDLTKRDRFFFAYR